MSEDPTLFAVDGPDGGSSPRHPFAFEAGRLTQARQAAGLTKARLAELVGVTPASIGQYEAHVIAPRLELIPGLARALDVPQEYFAAGRPLGRVDGSQAHFRSLRSTSSRERAKAIAFIEQVWELTFALEKRVQFPAVDLPTLAPDGITPASAARSLRAHWALGDKPVKHLVAQTEAHGIVVSLLSLASADVARVGAFSTSHLARPIIVVTPERARSVYVHRFTVAHEIGHVLLHHDAVPGDARQEREADQFAAEFLTPRDLITNFLPRSVNLARLHELSRHWGVSVESLLLRMKETGAVSEASIRRGYQRLHALRAVEHESPEPVFAYPGEVPTMLKEATQLVLSANFGEADLARELRWKPARLREVLGAEDMRPTLRLVGTRDERTFR